MCILEFFEVSRLYAADAHPDCSELRIVLLDLIDRFHDGGNVVIRFLAEDQHDGRTGLAVVFSDIAELLALQLAGDRLDIEGTADFLVGPGLDVVRLGRRQDQGEPGDRGQACRNTNLHAATPKKEKPNAKHAWSQRINLAISLI